MQTQVWMPRARSNVAQYDHEEDQKELPEDESGINGEDEDEKM